MIHNRNSIIATALLALTAIFGASAQLPFEMDGDSFVYRGLPTYVDRYGRMFMVLDSDTLHIDYLPDLRKIELLEQDYIDVAAELGVEVAAIKAVVDIETGRTHAGFGDDGRPLINFDPAVFRRMASRRGINTTRYTRSHPEVFSRPNIRRYGSIQAAEHAMFERACDIDSVAAIEGTFWGMFQIGGFNWQKCGVDSIEEFVNLMSRTERDQLELFAAFITNSGLLPALKQKNWAAFARGYNGPSYASHQYHTRMAQAYKKHLAD